MTTTTDANEFIQACVKRAADFRNCGMDRSSDLMLDVAAQVINRHSSEIKMFLYAGDMSTAIWSAFGDESRFADLSQTKAARALYNWSWYRQWTGDHLSPFLTKAIAAHEQAGISHSDRKRNVRRILESHPARLRGDADIDVMFYPVNS